MYYIPKKILKIEIAEVLEDARMCPSKNLYIYVLHRNGHYTGYSLSQEDALNFDEDIVLLPAFVFLCQLIALDLEESFTPFGALLVAVRNLCDISQTELANALGLSLRTVQRYEKGEADKATLNLINKLCDISKVDRKLFFEAYDYITKNN